MRHPENHTRPGQRWVLAALTLLCALTTTQSASAVALPDGRAYELVNPPGVDVGDIIRVPFVRDDGNALAYMSLTIPNGGLGGLIASSSLAQRTASGWISTDVNPAVPRGQSAQSYSIPAVFSPDLTQAILSTSASLTANDVDNGGPDLYRLIAGTGQSSYLTFGEGNLPDFDNSGVANFLGASTDLKRVVFLEQNSALLPGGPTNGVYARDADGLSLLSRLPGTPGAPPADVLSVASGGVHGGRHGISDDARRVFFDDVIGYCSSSCPQQGLYERDGDTTVAVSASQRAGDVGDPNHIWEFIGATHDGRVSYFNSPEQLTDAATPGGGIYRFDLDVYRVDPTRALEQITPANGDPTDPSSGEHVGLQTGGSWSQSGALLSDDGSHIYFSSPASLASGAVPGVNHLYVYTNGQTRFISAVSNGVAVTRTSRDGRYALFTSTDAIGGASNNGHQAIYEYDASSGQISCASCRADGSPSTGDARLEDAPRATLNPGLTRPRNMTDDGRVFFTSSDRIVNDDQTSAPDVYEYDHGKVSLVSTGTGDYISYLVDNSDDGSDVFFLTAEPLLSQDRDSQELDLYDARIGGGFAVAQSEAPAECRDDDCQGPTPAAPLLAAAGSARVSGPGDLLAAKASSKRLSVTSLTATQRSQLVRGRKVKLRVGVTGGGTVSVTGRSRIRNRLTRVVSGRVVEERRAQVGVFVTLALSSVAQRELKRSGHLTISLEARLSGLSKAAHVTVKLSRAHR